MRIQWKKVQEMVGWGLVFVKEKWEEENGRGRLLPFPGLGNKVSLPY